MESKPRLELGNTHRERRDALLSHLWAIGEAGVALEGFLERNEPAGTFFQTYEQETSALTHQERRRCLEIINAFRRSKQETKQTFAAWLKQSGLDTTQLSPSDLGKRFVELRFGFTPEYPVQLMEKPGFLLLLCEADDYEPISHALSENDLVQRSLGEYVSHMPLFPHAAIQQQKPIAFIMVRFPMMKNPTNFAREKSEQVLLHERQHFIQDRLLDRFTTDEPRPNEAFGSIKDEVLAYIRGGMGNTKLKELLTQENYPKLFPEETREENERIVEEIAASFSLATNLHNKRAELVYALTGTPLKKIASRIRALNEYRKQWHDE